MTTAFESRAAFLRPAWARVDLDRLTANLRYLQQRFDPAEILAVVKADAYGHGVGPVGAALASHGVSWLGVAMPEEGIELRNAGIEAAILVLGAPLPRQLEAYGKYRLTPVVSSRAQLEAWRHRSGAEAQDLHLKVDTGMGRLGLTPDELPEALAVVRAEPGLRLSGLMSHLAASDEVDSDQTESQARLMEDLLGLLTPVERSEILIHLANSAGALHHPRTRHGLVRAGLALYGLDPARRDPGLAPVMEVRARVVQVRQVEAGAALGYHGRWRASRPSRIGVLPVGYADGYPWRLTNRAEVLLGGGRVPVVGAVSMDLTLVDLTDSTAGLGETAVLLGEAGDERIDAWELAQRSDTIPYEILTGLGRRLPREYVTAGDPPEIFSRHLP